MVSPFERQSGLFLHPTSLPGEEGIGTLGQSAYEFVDALAAADQSLWQLCPLGPASPAHENSPYQTYSAFAGNPLLIDLRKLVERGLLTSSALTEQTGSPTAVNFERVTEQKEAALREAYASYEPEENTAIASRIEWLTENTDWFGSYVLFRALKREFDGEPFWEWPGRIRERDPVTIQKYRESLAHEIGFREFCQAVFHEQWAAVHEYATDHGVQIFGDIPIYVAADSADVWANPELFRVEDGEPTVVAGVPASAETPGQKWGNPVYDWAAMAEAGYDWWIRRIGWQLELTDIVRVDHFLGFVRYYTIPADSDPPAGEWNDGPGTDFFETVRQELGDPPVIAEDIGPSDEAMERLRDDINAPGIRVFQYADWCTEEHKYLPHACPEDAVAYPSTHDTDTARGYYRSMSDQQRDCIDYYLGTSEQSIHWDLLEAAWHSDAVLAVTMVQDLYGLGSGARFNTPGTTEDNWSWRLTRDQLAEFPVSRLRDITEASDRA